MAGRLALHVELRKLSLCADGYYREGTHAAGVAKTKGIKRLQVEKQRIKAEEKQRKVLQVGSCLTSSPHQAHSFALNIVGSVPVF